MPFSAEVLSAGQSGHAVAVPKEIAQTFSSKRPPVLAHVNGVEYRSRLMVYGGQSYLGLRKDLLRQLDVTVGELVEVDLVEDHQERVVVEPRELTKRSLTTQRPRPRTSDCPSPTVTSTRGGSTRGRNRKPVLIE